MSRMVYLLRTAVCSIIGQIKLVWRNRGCEIIIPGFAIGDIVFTSAIIREYKVLNPAKRFCLVVDGNRRGDCDAAELVGKSCFERIETGKLPVIPSKIQFSSIRKLWPHMWSVMCSSYGNENLVELLSQLISRKCFSLKKLLPISIPLSQYQENWSKYPRGKTVLICPSATSTVLPNADEVWTLVGLYLRQKGFSVVFNDRDDSHFKGFDTVFYDVKVTAAFAKYCGYVISLRCGIADLLAYVTNARILAVYSHNLNDWCWTVADAWKNAGYQEAGEEFLRYWSLSKLFDREGLYDCYYEGIDALRKNVDDLINDGGRRMT